MQTFHLNKNHVIKYLSINDAVILLWNLVWMILVRWEEDNISMLVYGVHSIFQWTSPFKCSLLALAEENIF